MPQGGQEDRVADTRPHGGTAGKAAVCPVPTNASGNQVLGGLVEEPLMELVSRNRSSHSPPKSECRRQRDGAPPKTHLPLRPHAPGTSCVSPPWASPALAFRWAGVRLAWGGGSVGAPRAGHRAPAARIPRWLRLQAAGPGRGKMLGIRVLEQRETGANTNNK